MQCLLQKQTSHRVAGTFNAIQHKGGILPIQTCNDFYVSFVYRHCHKQSTCCIVPWIFRQSTLLTIDNSTNLLYWIVFSFLFSTSAALQAVKPGGDVVYSTCTLSQLQNDDVIESTIYTCRSQLKIKVAVVDLSPLTSAFDEVFNFWRHCSYGQLVLPGFRRNFGPMYFCKLHKIE